MLVRKLVDVTADAELTPTDGLWVGGAGSVRVRMVSGDDVTIQGVQAGTLLPIGVTKVYGGGTSATLLLAAYAGGAR